MASYVVEGVSVHYTLREHEATVPASEHGAQSISYLYLQVKDIELFDNLITSFSIGLLL